MADGSNRSLKGGLVTSQILPATVIVLRAQGTDPSATIFLLGPIDRAGLQRTLGRYVYCASVVVIPRRHNKNRALRN
jgi:hypothetical protein